MALTGLHSGQSALTSAENAIAVLEDEPCLNAGAHVIPVPAPSLTSWLRRTGYGSNLTLDGTVECDAALMDGSTGDFGSVGAVSGMNTIVQRSFVPLS